MFSRKNFSWKKWATLTLFLFVFSWLLAYCLHLSGETRQDLLTMPSVTRRFAMALAVSLLISFIRIEPKQ